MGWGDFYTGSHIGDRFGATAGRDNPHRGQDIKGHAVWTGIPAWQRMRVVDKYRQSCLGYVIVGEILDGPWAGMFAGFSHNVRMPLHGIGAIVGQGYNIAELGNTGTCTTGPHCHATLSATSARPEWGGVRDPLPAILDSISSSPSGGDTAPFPNEGDGDMPTEEWLNGLGAAIVKQVNDHINDRVASLVWQTQVSRKTPAGKVYTVSALQELADAKSNTMELLGEEEDEAVVVDVKELAKEIVALLPEDTEDHAGPTADEIVDKFVERLQEGESPV